MVRKYGFHYHFVYYSLILFLSVYMFAFILDPIS